MTTQLLSSSSITGTKVYNSRGEHLGDIKDLMINTHSSAVNYAVLSFGGFLGLGDKYFAVPLEAFTIDRKDERFILDVNKERLENAPGFDKENWPNSSNDSFTDAVYDFYKVNRRYAEPALK